jgi:hypothetical protein
LDWSSFFLRFGFVVEGRRDGTSFGIKEMKWNPKRRQIFTKTQQNRFNFYLNVILKPWWFLLGLY